LLRGFSSSANRSASFAPRFAGAAGFDFFTDFFCDLAIDFDMGL
jgi:hypothetical protein